MKRLKQLLVFCMVAVLAFSFTACGSGDETTLSSISVDYSAAKTEYYVYDEFSSDGIVVTANYSDDSTTTLTSSQYTIDSSAYDSTKSGTYAIVITYEDKTTSYNVTVSYGTLSAITIDTSAVKTLFYIGQSFDYSGLQVTATINGASYDVSDEVTVDRSAFVSSEVGDYTIYVFYYYGPTYKYKSYTVTVTDEVPMAGLDIYIGDDITTEYIYELSDTTTSVTLSSDIISGVKLHEILYEEGTVDTTLSSSEYTVKICDADLNVLTGNDLTVTGGYYQLYVTYNYTDPAYETTYELMSFVKIFVDNPLTSIALNTNNGDAVYEQDQGSDTISATWTYTATYANGETEQLTASDVAVTIDTKTAADNAVATVSYTTYTASGKEVTKETTVSYKINEVVKEGTTSYTMTYAATVDSFATTWGANEDTDDTVTITNTGISTWVDKSKSTSDNDVTYQYAVETKAYSGKAFKVSVAEGATNVSITVYFSHTSKASRTLYLSTVADSTSDGVIDSLAIGTTDTSPSTLSTISGTGLSAGDYYIYSDGSTIHVYAIEISYDIVSSASTVYTMEYAATVDSFATTWGANEDTDDTVTITNTGISTWVDKSKSTSDNDVTYQYAVETKAYSGKAFKVSVAEGATNVSITVYFSHTSKASRTLYLSTVADSTSDGVIDSLAIGTTDTSPSTLSTISGTGLSAGDYYIYSDGSTIHVYAIIVTYEVGSASSSDYAMTYAATVDSFATTWGANEDTDDTVTITNTGISTWVDKSKSTSDNDVTYQYAVETKAYSGKAFKVSVAEGATNVSITVYFSHTSKASRTLYLSTVADSTSDGVIDSLAIGTTDTSPSTLSTISGTGLSAGDYYIYSDGSTIHVYAIVITYSL